MEKPVLEKMRDNKIFWKMKSEKPLPNTILWTRSREKAGAAGRKNALIFENIKTFLEQLLNIDADCAPVSLVSLENHYRTPLTVLLDGTEKMVWLAEKSTGLTA
jgi:hypothetical protein